MKIRRGRRVSKWNKLTRSKKKGRDRNVLLDKEEQVYLSLAPQVTNLIWEVTRIIFHPLFCSCLSSFSLSSSCLEVKRPFDGHSQVTSFDGMEKVSSILHVKWHLLKARSCLELKMTAKNGESESWACLNTFFKLCETIVLHKLQVPPHTKPWSFSQLVAAQSVNDCWIRINSFSARIHLPWLIHGTRTAQFGILTKFSSSQSAQFVYFQFRYPSSFRGASIRFGRSIFHLCVHLSRIAFCCVCETHKYLRSFHHLFCLHFSNSWCFLQNRLSRCCNFLLVLCHSSLSPLIRIDSSFWMEVLVCMLVSFDLIYVLYLTDCGSSRAGDERKGEAFSEWKRK